MEESFPAKERMGNMIHEVQSREDKKISGDALYHLLVRGIPASVVPLSMTIVSASDH